MATKYIIQRGDTLSTIAKQTTGDIKRYLEIAALNKISNPDLIYEGQEIIIPDKFDKPLTFEQIPTKNKKQIIDNYSPNYNYLVEGDKIYYSRKGHNDYWVDISDNDVARKNLYNFLNDKYNFKGYEDNEKEILEQINAGTYNYLDRNKQPNKLQGIINKQNLQDVLGINSEKPSSLSIAAPIENFNNSKLEQKPKKEEKPSNLENIYNTLGDYTEKGINWITRQFNKVFGDNDKLSTLQPKIPNLLNSNYQLIPESYTGKDTVTYGRQYIVPESIDLNNITLGVRNRGDYTQLNTEGGIITSFNSFKPAKTYKGAKGTYMGVDANGKFKVGTIDKFNENDLVSRTFENELVSFVKDDKGNQIYKNDAVHGNKSRSVPVVNMIVDGKVKQGSLNILTDKDNKGDTYGNITGGRLIVKAGNEYRLISGSIDTLEKQINDIKKRHNVKTVSVYTLDNGSYNRGLRTKDKVLTPQDLRSYDNQNSGGGNFMYIKPSAFATDTVRTPNIRTVNDDSYKQGHPLTNTQEGIVLHHTGFTDDKNLSKVTELLTKKGGNSAHVIIGEDGRRRVLAESEKVTFHARESRFNNRNNVNDFMVGIEFQGDTNKKDLTDNQIESAIEYMLPIIRKNKISLENITTHQKVRELYNEYANASGNKPGKDKPDINYSNYVKIINALKQRVYYYKPNGKRRNLDGQ